MFKPNMNERERVLRAILGVYAMLLGFMFIQGLAGSILGILGLIAFLTGATGWCGIYALMGRTLPESEPELAEVPVTVEE